MRLCLLGLCLLLLSGSKGFANSETAAAPATPPDPTALSQGQLQRAFQRLKSDYIHQERLDDLFINRAALDGLLQKLGFGAQIIRKDAEKDSSSSSDFRFEKLSSEAHYLHFKNFGEEEAAALDAGIAQIKDPSSRSLVIDLRNPGQLNDLGSIALLLSRFVEPNEMLFKVSLAGAAEADSSSRELFVSSPAPRNWRSDIILLMDGKSGGAAELFAGVIRSIRPCTIIGEQTKGKTVKFSTIDLGDGLALRYAVAEIELRDGSSLFQKGISPDVETIVGRAEKQMARRALIAGLPISQLVYRPERPRMNEAALVDGVDPELPYYLARSQKKPVEWDKHNVRDRLLQQAADVARIRQLLPSFR